jgi:ribose transport system ATP-binding protein
VSAASPESARVVLQATGIRKAFGGVVALDGVDFVLRAGEIHGLVGQNGAGKSTLVKILNGVHQPDDGRIELDGRPVSMASPSAARHAGIAMVFQEFSLIPTLTVAQNIHLTQEPRRAGVLIDHASSRRQTRELLERLGVDIDPRALVSSLPVGSQQLVEIAKAMSRSPSILILDEPTASLSQTEIDLLFGVLSNLRDQGVSIVYISHHLQEVLRVCDTITVLRDGRVQLTGPARDLSLERLVTAITGTSPGQRGAHDAAERPALDRTGTPALEVRDWNLGQRLRDIDLAVYEREIVGVAGLLGSGRSSLMRSIVGLEPDVRGSLRIAGRVTTIRSPSDALKAGVTYVPEDRRRQGIVAGQSVQANLLLNMWERLVTHFLIDERAASVRGAELMARLDVKSAGQRQLIEFLSGGNQQKVVVGRSMARGPAVLLLDDPTAGIDIGSRRDLLDHVRRFADDGGAVLLVSSELEDLARVADRIVILQHGAIGRILDRTVGDVLSEVTILSAIHTTDRSSAWNSFTAGWQLVD